MDVLRFLHVCERLKRTKRTGWIDNGIAAPESIADHMHRMAIIAMLVGDHTLDSGRCVKIAIVHDLAESIVGDITPHSGVSKEDKARMEDDAMKSIVDMLGNSEQAQEIYSLWREYEDGSTPEAMLIKDIDKFEMIVQAVEYEKSDGKRLQSFFDSTDGKFRHPVIKKWAEDLQKERSPQINESASN